MYDKQNPSTICDMFSKIARNYDRANALLSFGLHRIWNRQLVAAVKSAPSPRTLLDLCAGTGDIALQALRKKIVGRACLVDFCDEMLQVAQVKADRWRLPSERLSYLCHDVQSLPIEGESFCAVTIAYGIRNVKNPLRSLREVHRVLRPKGTVAILELTRPNNPFMRLAHRLYLKTCVPLFGKVATTEKNAYQYLSNSIQSFLSPKDLLAVMEQAGFKEVKAQSLTGGVATLFTGKK